MTTGAWQFLLYSRGTFPILSRDPSFQETIKKKKNRKKQQPVFEKNHG